MLIGVGVGAVIVVRRATTLSRVFCNRWIGLRITSALLSFFITVVFEYHCVASREPRAGRVLVRPNPIANGEVLVVLWLQQRRLRGCTRWLF